MPLAELNFGTLKHPWGDPRIADFQDNVDRVNAIAQRSQGFIWMLPDDQMDFEQSDPAGALAHRPNSASMLSVWQDAASLWAFVEKTIHVQFLRRGAEWFDPNDRSHLVIWHVDEGHRPSVVEGLAEWQLLQDGNETDTRFGGARLRELANGGA